MQLLAFQIFFVFIKFIYICLFLKYQIQYLNIHQIKFNKSKSKTNKKTKNYINCKKKNLSTEYMDCYLQPEVSREHHFRIWGGSPKHDRRTDEQTHVNYPVSCIKTHY